MENRKNKISFVIGSLTSGGAERVISTLSNELVKNFDVVIITFEKKQPFYFLDERVKVIACMENIEYPSSVLQSLKLNFSLAKNVSKIMKNEKVDIAIGFITSANIISTLAAKFNGIPSIISERNNPLRGDVPKFWVVLRKYVYPMADCVVLQTEGVKKIYERKIKSNKIVVLPNPISSELSKFRDESIKKEKIILTVGRLNDNKGHDMLIQVINEINTDGWKVLIIGDGNKKDELNDLIKINNLSDKIKIISKIKRIDHYYNKASVFVFTSKTEGFPNALLEAMYYGLPSISTDCDFGPSDLIKDGYNGFLIPVDNKTELVEKLSLLLSDTKLQQKFSERAKLTAEHYVSELVVSKWEKLINSLL